MSTPVLVHTFTTKSWIRCSKLVTAFRGKFLPTPNIKYTTAPSRTYSTNYETNKTKIRPKNVLKLHERGILQDIYPPAAVGLPGLLESKQQCFYCGFDPTADGLHVGNLLSIMVLLHCQRAGHNVIAVIGNATVRAGDPSEHTKDRNMLSDNAIQDNVNAIQDCIAKIADTHANYIYDNKHRKKLPDFKILFNQTWYKELNAIDFISTACRNFRIGPMMEKRYIKDRIQSSEGLMLAEFMYQVLQAYDWQYLHDNYNCTFQVGGVDQLGNINAGQQLIRKTNKGQVYALLTPLVTNLRGQKLGKTAGNSVWLNANKTPPFEFYQFFFKQPDSMVETFLKYFTFIDLKRINEIMIEHTKHPHLRNAQRILAKHVCKLVHGPEGLESAERCTRALFGGSLEDIEKLSEEEIMTTFNATNIVTAVLEPDTTVYDVATHAKAIPLGNKGENLIRAGGVRINGETVDSPHLILMNGEHVLKNDLTVLSVGKTNHFIIKWKLPRIKHDEDSVRETEYPVPM
uniref:Tyrosine--tRNA ligase n=1 Tax=Ciona intestinalis TaxID=7719 RepID=A0A1W5B7P7_CIOIN|nr:tyrosine--tRNA ligase, mitochondrial [Ciona intestinalis]|eukprot:XP_018668493.1 tyrosine--tRNA ligase, mitochondrial [Ciona intestinalis]